MTHAHLFTADEQPAYRITYPIHPLHHCGFCEVGRRAFPPTQCWACGRYGYPGDVMDIVRRRAA